MYNEWRERAVILLGTYNGERFLSDQLRSIQNQTVTGWKLLVRDDGSQDATCTILKEFASQDRRIVLLQDTRGRLGVVKNYDLLMQTALDVGATSIFFADQDDVWLPKKLRVQSESLERLEAMYGGDTPLLVHTDLVVTDANLTTLCRSFMNYQGIFHEEHLPLATLLVQNFVTGCASAVNRALLKVAVPVPEWSIMHDWWMALCAAAFGKIHYLSEPMVLYRQHGGNELGAKAWIEVFNPFRSYPLQRWRASKRNVEWTIRQAGALRERASERQRVIAEEELARIESYASCGSLFSAQRLCRAYQAGLRRQGWLRQVVFYMQLALIPTVGSGGGAASGGR